MESDARIDRFIHSGKRASPAFEVNSLTTVDSLLLLSIWSMKVHLEQSKVGRQSAEEHERIGKSDFELWLEFWFDWLGLEERG